MKLQISCWHCNILSFGELQLPPEDRLASGEIEDGGIVRIECRRGHSATYVLTDPLFELFFDLAGLALLDGYYREAVLGFATSLERFYEFYVQAFFVRRGTSPDAHASFCKGIAVQSERLMGAFLACYLVETGRTYIPLQQKYTELRNMVVHEGYLPARGEVLDLGRRAFTEMRRVLVEMVGDVKDKNRVGALTNVIASLGAQRRERLGEGEHAVGLGRHTMMAMMAPESWSVETFDNALERLKENRASTYGIEA
jgi:hypothetical protein